MVALDGAKASSRTFSSQAALLMQAVDVARDVEYL
jgi:hypothetical protein